MNIGETDRLFKLQTRANELLLASQRNAEPLLEFLQKFVFGSDLSVDLWFEVYKALDMEAEYEEAMKILKAEANPKLWLAPVIKGVVCNKVVAALRKLGCSMSLYTEDMDAEVMQNDRDPNRDGSYVVGFQKAVEADEENRNLSANQLKK